MTELRLLPSVVIGLLALSSVVPARGADHPVDFNREIRSILSDKCFTCHGPDDKTRKARLRLDLRESAIKPSRSGATAIVPGNVAESELVKRITTTDLDDRMPPPETGKVLQESQIELLKRWISEGAEYREHWAFVPPQKPAVPEVRADGVRIENAIDAFVVERLGEEGLKQSPEADRPTLIRRATLDTTGLPPTPEEIDAFLADDSPKAYEKLVDRLLDSPRFGERMTVEWLDAARYADTHGYHLDSGRDMTAWRDWVIRAYNENKPFDQFTVEQLAGDLLPNATREQKIATGFNRNHMINYEGGAIAEEYQYAYLVDRVNTTTTVWLGLTMACAQCHDHKYDPLTKEDYYRFMAFFNSVPEQGLDGSKGNAVPVVRLSTPEQEKRLAELSHQLKAAEKRLEEALPSIDVAQASWEEEQRSVVPPNWVVVDPVESRTASGAGFERLDDRSLRVKGTNPARDTYTLTISNTLAALTAIRLEAMSDPGLERKGPGRSENGNFLLSSVKVSSDGKPLPLKKATADYSQSHYPVRAAIDDSSETGWAVDGGIGKTHAAVFELESPAGPGILELTLEFQSGFDRHAIGRLRLAATDSPRPDVESTLSEEIRTLLAIAVPERSSNQLASVQKFYREKVSPEHKRLREEIGKVRKEREEFESGIPTTMVMSEMEKPRDTFVHIRGEYDKLGEKVAAATPGYLPNHVSGGPTNRLSLARWLVSPDHPLTARVIVNRYWQMHFGTGLVKTAEDFGSQGEWPSHPELLDWLSREFIESGWDVKHMQRLVLTSATYRQSSRVSEEAAQMDPENRLLARGPRFRLAGEFIRDQALVISGLLNGDIGGSSVFPYQPQGLWSELSMREDSKKFSAQFFVQSQGRDLYRRSMYTFWKRSSPPPQLSTFDAPSRETCTVRRPRTNTPLQALILLNDPTYIEASRKLAERLMRYAESDVDRIRKAFRLATARLPNANEEAVLLRILGQQREYYKSRAEAADKLLSNGDAPRDPTLDPKELAAWTMLSSTILNLDETVTKG